MHVVNSGWLALLLSCAACAETPEDALPKREAGMWEVTITNERASRRLRQVTTRQCTDDALDTKLLLSMAMEQDHCSAIRVWKTDAGWEVHTACMVHDNRLDIRFVLEGDFRSHYSGHFETRYDPHCPANARDCIETRTFSAQRLGACPDDLRPGDTLLPNGIVVTTSNADRPHEHPHDDEHSHDHDHRHDHD